MLRFIRFSLIRQINLHNHSNRSIMYILCSKFPHIFILLPKWNKTIHYDFQSMPLKKMSIKLLGKLQRWKATNLYWISPIWNNKYYCDSTHFKYIYYISTTFWVATRHAYGENIRPEMYCFQDKVLYFCQKILVTLLLQ